MSEATQEAPEVGQTQESQGHQSLMDVGSLQDAPSPTSNDTVEGDRQQESQWLWAEGVIGQGDKPDWLKERYTSVSEQAKAYNELEKKLGEFRGAPKDGYSMESLGELKDDPLINHFSKTFQELNLTQEGFERVAQEFLQVQQELTKVDMESELKKIGPNAKEKIGQLNRMIDNKFEDSVAQTIKSWVSGADDIQALHALLSLSPKTNVPSFAEFSEQPTYESTSNLVEEKKNNWKRYQEDANYRKSWLSRLEMADARERSLKR